MLNACKVVNGQTYLSTVTRNAESQALSVYELSSIQKEPGRRIYIAGPMRGYPEMNFPAFFAAEERLRLLGWDPINPARNEGDSQPFSYYMRLDLTNVLCANALAVLPGWEKSHGANMEVAVALTIGIPIYDSVTMEEITGLVPAVSFKQGEGLLGGFSDRPPLVLGIAGHKRHGKNQMAEFLKPLLEASGFQVYIRAMADALKDEVTSAIAPHLGLSMEETRKKFDTPEEKEKFRLLLQWWGTELRRNQFSENYWLDRMTEFVTSAVRKANGPVAILVPDIRFLNEVEWVRQWKGSVIRVERPSIVSSDTHPSETALDDYHGFDLNILNKGTLEDLNDQIKTVFSCLMERSLPEACDRTEETRKAAS